MTGSFWLDLLIGAGTALLLAWLALIAALVALARLTGLPDTTPS